MECALVDRHLRPTLVCLLTTRLVEVDRAVLEVDLLPPKVQQCAHASAGGDREYNKQANVRCAHMLQQRVELFTGKVAIAWCAASRKPDAAVTPTVAQV